MQGQYSESLSIASERKNLPERRNLPVRPQNTFLITTHHERTPNTDNWQGMKLREISKQRLNSLQV
jgi:hypothetical protein